MTAMTLEERWAERLGLRPWWVDERPGGSVVLRFVGTASVRKASRALVGDGVPHRLAGKFGLEVKP